MFKNYLKIALRNLQKQKLYSLINIGGLAVGLAVCIMIMLYVTHEMTYDRFHGNADRIYKVQAKINIGGNVMNMDYMSYGSGPLVKQTLPALDDYVRTLKQRNAVTVSKTTTPDNKFAEEKLLFADANFFKVFSFKLKDGSVNNALEKPFSVVLSADMAKKYFGDADPIGQTINIHTDSTYTYQVTGVVENAPSNSSIEYNFLVSSSTLGLTAGTKLYTGQKEIGPGSFDLYLLLKNASDTANIRRGMQTMVDKKIAAKDSYSIPETHFSLTSLKNIHLVSNFGDASNIKYLKIFPLVAALILLLALVNYMSLTTAKATLRAKEVGVRKVSGASRNTIAAQFYVESGVFTLISFVLGYALCYLLKPAFLNILDLKIDNSFLYSPVVLMLLAGLFLLTAIVAGVYPSVILSSFKPIVTLKGKMSRQAGGVVVRKVFTTLQFSIAVGLIICGLVINKQLFYLRHADTGLDRENVLMIPVTKNFEKGFAAFKHDVQSLAGVKTVATANYALYRGYDMFFIEGKKPGENIALANLAVDQNYMATLGLRWKYAPLPSTKLDEKDNVIINELAISRLSLPANPIGSFIKNGSTNLKVVGVVKNFNFSTMQSAIEPLSLEIAPDTSSAWAKTNGTLFARIKPNTNLPALLKTLGGLYKKYDNDTHFNYTFLDDAFNSQYKAEDRLAAIFSTFIYITIMLATLGLFGLAAFTIEQRTKEIGIRKVLGASLSTITSLLSKDFLKLVILAVIIASPVAWYAMNNWLQNFAYRISVPWWVFAVAGVIAVATSVLTVSYHAIKAALANPVKSLRSE